MIFGSLLKCNVKSLTVVNYVSTLISSALPTKALLCLVPRVKLVHASGQGCWIVTYDIVKLKWLVFLMRALPLAGYCMDAASLVR